jgi:hypothetical protein
MYVSTQNRIEHNTIEVERITNAPTLGDYSIRLGILTTVYMTQEELERLHSSIFEALITKTSDSNVKVVK